MQGKLILIRESYGLTQSFVAEKLGLSKTEYISKETGNYPFSSYEMFKVSELFRKPISDIFLPRGNRNGDINMISH